MNIKPKRQFIVTIEGSWLEGDKKVTAAQVAAGVRQAIKREFQFLAKRTSVKRVPVTTISARCEECAGTGKIGPDDNPSEMDCEVCNGTALDHEQQTAAQFSSLK